LVPANNELIVVGNQIKLLQVEIHVDEVLYDFSYFTQLISIEYLGISRYVFQHLSTKEVNKVHLVCHNLHQIANLFVHPELKIESWCGKNLEALAQSSRMVEELNFQSHVELLEENKNFKAIKPFIIHCWPRQET
jgi:hypothetical protein